MDSLTQRYNTDKLGYAYVALLFAGGLTGFLKAGSVASLVASSVFAAITAFGIDRLHSKGKYDVVLGATALLTVVMGRRFARSGKVMPGGVITAVSLGTFIRYALQAFA